MALDRTMDMSIIDVNRTVKASPRDPVALSRLRSNERHRLPGDKGGELDALHRARGCGERRWRCACAAPAPALRGVEEPPAFLPTRLFAARWVGPRARRPKSRLRWTRPTGAPRARCSTSIALRGAPSTIPRLASLARPPSKSRRFARGQASSPARRHAVRPAFSPGG